jgi:peptidoglycan hydrolase-like protein with peptidoglycan-binding domain
MDIRDILNTIDHLSEGIFDNDEVAAKNVQAQAEYKQWTADRDTQHQSEIEKIKQLIDQYAKLKGVATESISISKELIESFGYTTNEGILGKLLPGVGSVLSIKDAYDRWQQGDRSGAVISALSGIGYLIPGPFGWAIGGGLEATNALKDAGVSPSDIISPTTEPAPQQTVPQNAPQDAVPDAQPSEENAPSELQTNLVNSGYDIGPTGVDGKIGPNTAAAIQKFSTDNGFENDIKAIAYLVGIDPDGELSESTDYNTLSDNDKMKYALSLLDEARLKTPRLPRRTKPTAPKPGIAKRVLRGGMSFLLNHPIISGIIASLAVYGIMFDDMGNLISSYVNNGSPEEPAQTSTINQGGKPAEPANANTTANSATTNNPQLDQLAYQIDFALRHFTTAVSPAIQQQLDALKATWAYYK